jgi:7-cyano-7-deazaguanine synthase in queuosine biosynthesis
MHHSFVETSYNPRELLHVETGDRVSLDFDSLENYAFSPLTPEDVDILQISAAIAYVDRRAPRRIKGPWTRSFELTLPVYNPRLWSDKMVQQNLTYLLCLLTGDSWKLNFFARHENTIYKDAAALRRSHISDNKTLPFKAPNTAGVLMYSDGMDSFLTRAIWDASEKPRNYILVSTTRHRARLNVPTTPGSLQKSRVQLTAPLYFPKGRATSFRTRAFIYLTTSFLAAAKSNSDQVILGENGVGALGPFLIRIGNEPPLIGSNPIATNAYANFFNHLMGTNISCQHPNLWRTKAEVIGEYIRKNGAPRELQKTSSCSYDARHSTKNCKRVPCGICGGCLYRRMSLSVAGLSDNDSYLIEDLNESDLYAYSKRIDKSPRSKTRTGHFSAMHMSALAKHSLSLDNPRFLALTVELANTLGDTQEKTTSQMRRMLRAYQFEFDQFRDALTKDAWFHLMYEIA